jgi:hypothetical protein
LLAGYCSRAPKNGVTSLSSRSSPTTTSMPSGSARVRSTSRVCGWQCTEAKKVAALVLAQALAEGHGFGGGGGFVEQRGVGDRQAGEVADQGLEVQQRFETALGNFRLVRGVGGVPGRVFQQVAQDRRRRVGVVVALADVGLEQLVLGRRWL